MVFCAEELSMARQPFVNNINVGVNHSPKQPFQQKPGIEIGLYIASLVQKKPKGIEK